MFKKILLTITFIFGICGFSNAQEIYVLDSSSSKVYIEDTSIQYIGLSENYNIIDVNVISKKNDGTTLKAKVRYYFNINGREIKYCYLNLEQSLDGEKTWLNINNKIINDINNIHTAMKEKNIYSLQNSYVANKVYYLYNTK